MQLESQVSTLECLLREPATRLCPALGAAATDSSLALLSGLQAARLALGVNSPADIGLAAQLDAATQQLLDALQQGLAPLTPVPPPTHPSASSRGVDSGVDIDCGTRSLELVQLVQRLGFSTQDWQATQVDLAQRTAAALQQPPGSASADANTCLPLDRLLRAAVHTPAWHACGGQPSELHGAVQQLLGALRQQAPACCAAALGGSQQPTHRGKAQQPAQQDPQHAQQAAQLELSEDGWAAYWMLEPLVGMLACHALGALAASLPPVPGCWGSTHTLTQQAGLLFAASLQRQAQPAVPASPLPALQALQQTLAEVLQESSALVPAEMPSMESGARQPGQRQQQGREQPARDVASVLQQQPRWAATAGAAAEHPALHLAIRQTLHSWLAASGNPAVWRLLLLYLQAACGRAGCCSADGLAGPAGPTGSRAQHAQRGPGCLPHRQLPAHLAVLHPPALAHVASLLLLEPPSEAALERGVAGLQAFLQQPSTGDEQGQHGMNCGPLPAGLPGSAEQQGCLAQRQLAQRQRLADERLAAARRQEAAWQLQLDAPGWALYCLRRVPLLRLLTLVEETELMSVAASQGGAGEGAGCPRPAGPAAHVCDEGATASEGTSAAAAAAAYISLLAWPGEPHRRRVLRDALCLQLGDVDLPAVRPWLDMLLRWQRMLEGWRPVAV